MKHQEKLQRLKKYTRVYRKLVNVDGKWIETASPYVGQFLKDVGLSRRKPIKRSFSSIKEAAHFALYGVEVIAVPTVGSEVMTFKAAFELWKVKAMSKVEEQTWARYISYEKHFSFFKAMPMETITPEVIDQWFALIRSRAYLSTQRSVRVDYRHEVNVLKQVFRHYQERINRNFPWPFLKEHSQMMDLGRRRKRPEKDLKPDEFQSFLECLKTICCAAECEIVYWILLLQYALCLRVQEAAALSFEDFDLQRGQVTVGRRVVWARSKGFVTKIKDGTKANPAKRSSSRGWVERLFRHG